MSFPLENKVGVIAEKRLAALFAEPDGLIVEEVELQVLYEVFVSKFVIHPHLMGDAEVDDLGIPSVLGAMSVSTNESKILEGAGGAMNHVLCDAVGEASWDSNGGRPGVHLPNFFSPQTLEDLAFICGPEEVVCVFE